MSSKTITIPDEIYERMETIATAEGRTVEQPAIKALERDLARRWLGRVGRVGQLRRGSMTDDEVEIAVEAAIQDARGQAPPGE